MYPNCEWFSNGLKDLSPNHSRWCEKSILVVRILTAELTAPICWAAFIHHTASCDHHHRHHHHHTARCDYRHHHHHHTAIVKSGDCLLLQICTNYSLRCSPVEISLFFVCWNLPWFACWGASSHKCLHPASSFLPGAKANWVVAALHASKNCGFLFCLMRLHRIQLEIFSVSLNHKACLFLSLPLICASS